jgi:hypothetical protein
MIDESVKQAKIAAADCKKVYRVANDALNLQSLILQFLPPKKECMR